MKLVNTRTPFRKTAVGKIWESARRKGWRLRKEVYQHCLSHDIDKTVVLIFGCQRSGTTMLGYVFANDLRTAVLQEQSCLTRERSLRLKPSSDINRLISGFRAPLIVVKPIVESQQADLLLAEISNSKAIWMYRNFNDVVHSNVRRFRSQVEGLKSVVEGSPKTWRNERVSAETMSLLRHFYHEGISRSNAAALGWYARNILFFELGLDQSPAVRLCRYENLVTSPEEVMRDLYCHLDVEYPTYSITNEIDQMSLGHGKEANIDSDIAVLCTELYRRLEECHGSTSQKDAPQLATCASLALGDTKSC